MGDTLKREFSLDPVDTGRVQPGTTPGTTPPFMPGGAPSVDPTTGFPAGGDGTKFDPLKMGQPSQPEQPPPQPITRPSFLQAFLSNLGPALAGGLHSEPGAPFGTGLGGALQGIEEQRRYQQGVETQARQFGITEEGLRLRAEREATLEQLRLEQEKNYQSLIKTRENPPPKTQLEQYSRDFSTALASGDQDAAQQALKNINDLSKAKSTKEPNPVNDALQAAAAAQQRGDTAEFQKQLDLAKTLTQAKRTSAPNELELIRTANAGGADAAAAQKDLATLQARRKEIASARGGGQYANFYDPDLGRNVRISNEDAKAQAAAGKDLIPTGPVSSTQIMQTQRAQSAIPAAIAEVEKHIKAWDNPTNRAIFAQAIKETPGSADHQTWFSNMLGQVAVDKLDDDGKAAVIALRRLNESLGSLRVVAALPSTTGSMAATLALAPGSQTPNSKFAHDQLQTIKKLVEQETGIPFLGMGKKTAQAEGGGETPKRRTIDLTTGP